MTIAKRLDDLEAIQWATVGALSQSWQSDQLEVKKNAIFLAEHTLKRLRKTGKRDEAAAYQRRLDEALVRDCLVRISWTGNADVDLLVEEPSGTICSLRSPRTTGGGVMLNDTYARFDKPGSNEFTETYVCSKGFSGSYRVLLRRIWGDITAGKVTVDIYRQFRTNRVEHQRKQIPVGDRDAVVEFKLDAGRRTEPLAQHRIANVAKDVILNRAILARQLSSLSESGVVPNRFNGGAPFDRRLAGVRGAVGFQPVIITLPRGRNFIVTGVISADRRYVRVTPMFILSDVTEVNTFTFAGASQQVDADAGADAGGDADGLDAGGGDDGDAGDADGGDADGGA